MRWPHGYIWIYQRAESGGEEGIGDANLKQQLWLESLSLKGIRMIVTREKRWRFEKTVEADVKRG